MSENTNQHFAKIFIVNGSQVLFTKDFEDDQLAIVVRTDFDDGSGSVTLSLKMSFDSHDDLQDAFERSSKKFAKSFRTQMIKQIKR